MKSLILARTQEKTNPYNNPGPNSKAPKRDKLKNLLILKYMKMFGLTEESRLLNEQVGKFLEKDKVNDADLKKLEKHLAVTFNKKELLHPTTVNQQTNNEQVNNVNLPPIENKTAGSGLGKTTSHIAAMELNDDDLFMEDGRNKKEIHKNGDEWNKIISYNKKVFDNEKAQKEQKVKEQKISTKVNLDMQINEKNAKNQEEAIENQQYFNYILNDVARYNKTEKEKQEEIKRKMFKEKEIRDIQLREEKKRKKKESQLELEHDKLLIQKQLDKIEAEKKSAFEKKAKEREAYNQIQKANVEYKKHQLEMRRQERENDIRAMDEYARILDKQERDRAEYFKRCENKQNDFMSKMAENVVKINDNRLAKEDEKIVKYQNEREMMNQLEEERRKKRQADQNMETKKFLDMQIDYKKRENEMDKKNSIQHARYLQEDTKIFEMQEQEKTKKVRLKFLKLYIR